eukprot:15470026-Alexandrium_andersonii.AAC.1
MNEKFMCKVEGRLGRGARGLQEVRLLSRVIRWTPEGLLYEADPRRAEQLQRDLPRSASADGRGISFPGFRREAEAEEAAEPLGSSQ